MNDDGIHSLLNAQVIAPAAKAVAIPNGVDVEYFRSATTSISSPPSIIFVGSLNWYPNVDAATLYICPIRDGRGTKRKLLDAFAMQKCVIAHPVACEGIDVTPGRDVEFAESAGAFVEAIRRLLADPAERESRGRAARQLVVGRYSYAEIGRRLCDLFESAAAGNC